MQKKWLSALANPCHPLHMIKNVLYPLYMQKNMVASPCHPCTVQRLKKCLVPSCTCTKKFASPCHPLALSLSDTGLCLLRYIYINLDPENPPRKNQFKHKKKLEPNIKTAQQRRMSQRSQTCFWAPQKLFFIQTNQMKYNFSVLRKPPQVFFLFTKTKLKV